MEEQAPGRIRPTPALFPIVDSGSGDADADAFKKAVIEDFGSGLNATIGGAIWAYPQWIKKADKIGWNAAKVESRKRILADLQAIVAGTFALRTAA